MRIGLRSGRLLFWGLLRFLLFAAITAILAGVVLDRQPDITELLWTRPSSPWVAWIWHLFSWFLSLLLIASSAVLSFVIGQVLFSAVIMDHMSRITELRATGRIAQGARFTLFGTFLHLIRQEIPRVILPLLFSLLLLIVGWFTPFGPLMATVSALISILFLSWDNTDLVPARRLLPFKERLRLLTSTIPFHIGFGLLFLVPGLNLVSLSFAPVGATLYFLDRHGQAKSAQSNEEPSTGERSGLSN
jgi:CysZ protein